MQKDKRPQEAHSRWTNSQPGPLWDMQWCGRQEEWGAPVPRNHNLWRLWLLKPDRVNLRKRRRRDPFLKLFSVNRHSVVLRSSSPIQHCLKKVHLHPLCGYQWNPMSSGNFFRKGESIHWNNMFNAQDGSGDIWMFQWYRFHSPSQFTLNMK